MATKKGEREKKGSDDRDSSHVSASPPPLLDKVFPRWEIAADASPSTKAGVKTDAGALFEDPDGRVLPKALTKVVDAWKRPGELVAGKADIPVFVQSQATTGDVGSGATHTGGAEGAADGAATGERMELFAGSASYEWLLSVFNAVKERVVEVKEGGADSLWKLVHPQDEKTGLPVVSPTGRYDVQLFIVDGWRRVTVDDEIPVDIFGMPLLIGCRLLQLWPLLLTKAIFKVMHVYKCLDAKTPRAVPALSWLTGWHHEVLPVSQRKMALVYDKLEDGLTKMDSDTERTLVTCNLKRMATPSRAPPRMLVVCGPEGAGKEEVVACLTSELKGIGCCISHTTRKPREHEVDGQHHFFISNEEMDAKVAEDFFLMHEDCYGGDFSTGYSLSTVRDVAASGLMCVLTVDVLGVRALRKRPGVDALYVFVGPESLESYEKYLRTRLTEDESTIQLRLADAKANFDAVDAGAGDASEQQQQPFDVLVDHEYDALYAQTKSVISALSPVIRNRLKGLPAYVLDYADVIPSNSVERPVAKPVLLAGPPSRSKSRLIEDLMAEFPDVFCIPTVHTTSETEALRTVEVRHRRRMNSLEAVEDKGNASTEERKVYEYVTDEAFSAMEEAGEFLVCAKDKFVHDTLKRRYGVTRSCIEEISEAEKLCLLDMDVASALRFGEESGMDPMMLAVMPESVDAFEAEVRGKLLEDEEAVKKMLEFAGRDLEACCSNNEDGVFDYVFRGTGDAGSKAEAVREVLSIHRPDVAPPRSEIKAETIKKPILVCCDEVLGNHLDDAIASIIALSPDEQLRALPVVSIGERGEGGDEVSAEDVEAMISSGDCVALETGEDGSTLRAARVTEISRLSQEGAVTLAHVSVATALAMVEKGVEADFIYMSSDVEPTAAPAGPQVVAAASPGDSKDQRDQEPDETPRGAYAQLRDMGSREDVSGTLSSRFCVEPAMAQAELYALVSELQQGALPPLPRPVVLCGTGGTGKALFLKMLQDRYAHGFAQPKATTSREPRDAQEAAAAAKGEAAYHFVRRDTMAQAIEDGLFLEHCESLNGALYGVAYSAVTVVQSTGKTCVILADSVEDVRSMRAKGFDASYIFLRLSSDTVLAERLGKMPLEAAEVGARLETYKAEVARFDETRAETLFDAELEVDDVENAYFRLADVISSVPGCVLPKSDVWGFGRCLWDASERVPGEYPLRMCVLGPALSGKSSQCELLSARFKCPHLAVGELLKAAVESTSELGKRARRYIDASRNVPDDIIIDLLRDRLQRDDCRQYGWVLDGFPKTVSQAKRLGELKIVPDKVIFLYVRHEDLYRRSEGRRIDPVTGKTYNANDDMPEGDEAINRLTIRHDDLRENVTARLGHYEKHEPALKENYHEMSTYVDGGATRRTILGEIVSFITTEDRLSGTMTVTSASTLCKPDYVITGVHKYQRKRLLRLQALGTGLRPVWVDLRELPEYVSDFVLLRNQSHAVCTRHVDCLTTDSLTGAKMMYIDSPEPVSISVSLSIGPQPQLENALGVQKTALVITGPSGVGKSTLIELLKQEFPSKFGFSVSHTTRAPRPGEVDGVDYHFTTRDAMCDLLSEGSFLESAEVHGNLYGTSYEAVETLAKEGRMCILDIDVQGAATVRRSGKVDAIYIFVEPPSLSILEDRLRGRNTDDDETIMRRVKNAKAEMERSMEEGLFDHRIVNDNVLAAYSKLKLILSESWARVDEPLLCHMNFESFDPKTFATRSMLRFASGSSSSAVLDVPRGKTMVRAKAEPGFIFRSEFCSMDSEFQIGDVGDVLAEHAGKSFSGFHGTVPSAPTAETLPEAHARLGEWGLLCRKIFYVDDRETHVEVELRLSSDDVQRFAVLAFVNNDTGKEDVFLSGRMSRTALEPNAHGYSIIAYYQGLKAETVSRGEWKLSVISDDELRYVELPTGSQSSAHFHDEYSPNKRAQLCSYRLHGRTHQVLSMHFSISCECRAVFTVVLAKGGVVVRKCEELVNACTFLGIPLDFEAGGDAKPQSGATAARTDTTPESEYTISVFLSRDSCPFKIQPAGAVSVPLSWRLQLEAPFELEVSKDDTLERQFAATLAEWNDAGAGGPEKRPATAKAALERFMHEETDRAGAPDDGDAPDTDADDPDASATAEKAEGFGLLGLNTTRSVDGLEEPLQLNKEASFVVLSSSSGENGDAAGAGDENISHGSPKKTKQLYFDKAASLYVMREALGSN